MWRRVWVANLAVFDAFIVAALVDMAVQAIKRWRRKHA